MDRLIKLVVMACMHMAVLQALSILFLASMPMLVAGSAEEEAPSGYRFDLIDVDANGNFTREELIGRAVNRSRLRAAMLSAEDDTPLSFPAKYSTDKYLMELKMGTPWETTFLAVADTGSELVWTNKMKVCTGSPSFTTTDKPCPDAVCRTAGKHCNSCMFNKTYGEGKTGMTGFVGKEMLTLPTATGTDKKVPITLVCAISWTDGMLPEFGEGIVGLSRGPMSLVKQLEVTKFSYCLSNPLEPKLRSPLWFGDVKPGDLGLKPEGWNMTSLVEISSDHKLGPATTNKYYVELDEICIHGGACTELKKEYFKFKGEKKGLMFVDSGCPYTHLDSKIFAALKELLEQALKEEKTDAQGAKVEVVHKLVHDPVSKVDCFEEPFPLGRPDMILKFTQDGADSAQKRKDGADLHLPWANYVNEDFCLNIWDSDKSILGNMQQQNLYMLYDLTEKKEKLSFKRVDDCSKLN